jgi:hypothetical protein
MTTSQRIADHMDDNGFRALQNRLGQWDARRRQAALLRWLPRALAAALLVGLVVALAARARPLLTAGEIALLSAALAGVAVSSNGMATLWPAVARWPNRRASPTAALACANGRRRRSKSRPGSTTSARRSPRGN